MMRFRVKTAVGSRHSGVGSLPIADCRLPPNRSMLIYFLRCSVLASALFASLAALAVEPGEMLADPKLEARARAVAAELRCLVCQNQSIDDSDAPLAKDLRIVIREKLKEGASDSDIRAFLVSRYGDFVLLRPPLKPETYLLWAAPLIALVAGAWAVFFAAKRSRQEAPVALTRAEREQLKALGASIGEAGARDEKDSAALDRESHGPTETKPHG